MILLNHMRTSSLVTISLPPALVTNAEKVARKQHMTRSELFRNALRRYLEERMADEAIRVYQKERREGKLKVLPPGGFAALMD